MTAPQTDLYQIESTFLLLPNATPTLSAVRLPLKEARNLCRREKRRDPHHRYRPVLYVPPVWTIYDEADYLVEVQARVEKEALAAGKRGRP